MEEGRRAVCAQPGHLAAQRGRGRGGRWSRGRGSAGKRDISPPLFPALSAAFCSVGRSFRPRSLCSGSLNSSLCQTSGVISCLCCSYLSCMCTAALPVCSLRWTGCIYLCQAGNCWALPMVHLSQCLTEKHTSEGVTCLFPKRKKDRNAAGTIETTLN